MGISGVDVGGISGVNVCLQESVMSMFVCRNQLLLAVARQHGFSKVVLGDTATLLSMRIMTDMAKGKGAQVSFDTVSVSQLHVYVCVYRGVERWGNFYLVFLKVYLKK